MTDNELISELEKNLEVFAGQFGVLNTSPVQQLLERISSISNRERESLLEI